MLSRRGLLAGAGAMALPLPGRASDVFREITWDDLIEPGAPYSEIVGEGEMDEANDRWKPVFDANASRINPALDGERVKMPGYVVPLTMTFAGATEFILVPYQGACIHTPPPPPNQLVLVTTTTPWKAEDEWVAIWVYGTLRAVPHSTEIAEIGYEMSARRIEVYEWM